MTRFSVCSLCPVVAVYSAAFLIAGSPVLAAKDDRPPEVASPGDVKPGKTALLTSTGKGMRYFLRVPKRYDARDGARLIVFLHGSNMNGLSYLRSFERKRWCEDAILCCPNGESGSDPFGSNNFGFDSGPAVAEVTKEVQAAFKSTVTYIGGHSQGAFLTYNVILHFPELYRGAFPMAGDCWSQNEPNLWEDRPETLAKQRDIAIAVIHGQKDPVVKFSQGEHAYDCFRAMGWTKLRLFAPANLNHMFMAAPVDEAIEWLDAMNNRDDRKSASLAAKWAKDGEWGWAWHAAESGATSASLRRSAESAAAKALAELREEETKKNEEEKPDDRVLRWVEFRRIHGMTEAARPAIAEFLARRSDQRAGAERLFRESQALFRANKRDEAFAVLENLRDEAPDTYQGFFACRWLANRK